LRPGALGAGALIGAALLPSLKRRASLDGLVVNSTILFGAVTLVSAFLRNLPLLVIAMLVGGIGWMVLISSLNVAARMVVPGLGPGPISCGLPPRLSGQHSFGQCHLGRVRRKSRRALDAGRGRCRVGTHVSLARRYSLKGGEALDLSPTGRWPAPKMPADSQPEAGPVLVTVEYEIDSGDVEKFADEMGEMEGARRWDGALQWGLFLDSSAPGRYLEEFLVESWLEHLRQHERVTVSDRELEARVWALHKGPQPPRVTHYIAEERLNK